MIFLNLPTLQDLQPYLAQQKQLAFTYLPIGQTKETAKVANYDNDFNEQYLGEGKLVFAAAKFALQKWKMFPAPWTVLQPTAPIVVGETVSMCAKAFGFWWRNACRIVYVIDEPRRFGFAYGTLPGHVEMGEELFLIEMDEKGSVRYIIKAFSRPRHWMARVGYPMMRYFQKKFQEDSKAAMMVEVSNSLVLNP
jgi:uncharacterized protein (UPF0548 family)